MAGDQSSAGGLKAPLSSKCFLYPPEMAYYQPSGLGYVRDFRNPVAK
jgi:hypothetical protein